MSAIYEHQHTVQADEIDLLGHANNLCYLQWMMAAAMAHSTVQGWPIERYQQLGAGWVVRSHKIEYLRPAFQGETLLVRTWVAATRRVTSLRRYKIVRLVDDALLAEAETDWAFVEFGSGRIRRIPPDVAEAFVVVEDELEPK
jgi:acyl-CoA thioester hydrolase